MEMNVFHIRGRQQILMRQMTNIPKFVWMLWIRIILRALYITFGQVLNLMWYHYRRAWFGLLQENVALVGTVISIYRSRGPGDLCLNVRNVVAVCMDCKILVSILGPVPKDVRLVRV